MDSLTHLVAGALTPIAFRAAPKRAALVAFGIVAGELPDIDVFFGSSPEALMTLHRGITHALVWQPVLALVALLPFYLWMCNRPAVYAAQGPPFVKSPPGAGRPYGGAPSFLFLYAAALLALFTHVYLDCMTTFGTQALLPFSSVRIGLPAMFIVDPILTVPALCLLVLALRQSPEYLETEGFSGARYGCFTRTGPARQTGKNAVFSSRARTFARAGLAWVLVYPLLALGVNALTTAAVAPDLREQAGADSGARVILLTEPFAPFVWKSVVDTGEEWALGRVVTLRPERESAPAFHPKPDSKLYASLMRQEPVFAVFAEFAPLMIQTEHQVPARVRAQYAGDVREFAFADLRYVFARGSFVRSIGRGDAMFVLEARVNESGGLLAYRFLHREAEQETPWIRIQ